MLKEEWSALDNDNGDVDGQSREVAIEVQRVQFSETD
jgi:hypothetical protein